jgi:cyclic pyranopterin phosphate synthase
MDDVLIDGSNRRINYLRMSVTDRCNLRCVYCVPPEGDRKLNHRDILRYEELLRISRIAIRLGINKIRITGGEPFVRKGIQEFIPRLSALKGLEDVSITTNGVHLKDNLETLKAAGINRLNISIDSLNAAKFEKITRFDCFDAVWQAIERANDMGFYPIKLNIVIMKGVNDNEIMDFGCLAIERPYYLRFIECMPLGLRANGTAFISNTEVQRTLEKGIGPLRPITPAANDGPARRYKFDGGAGEIGFISPISHSFCESCNRLRLTANGVLLPCLLSNREVDLRGPIREGCLDEALIEAFKRAVALKPVSHTSRLESEREQHRKMCSIGG